MLHFDFSWDLSGGMGEAERTGKGPKSIAYKPRSRPWEVSYSSLPKPRNGQWFSTPDPDYAHPAQRPWTHHAPGSRQRLGVVGYFDFGSFWSRKLSKTNSPDRLPPATSAKPCGFRFSFRVWFSVSNRTELTQLISSFFSLLNNEKCHRSSLLSTSLDTWPINVSIY